jgi:hypothetical protein
MGGQYTKWKVEDQSFQPDQGRACNVQSSACCCSSLAALSMVSDGASKIASA